MAKITSIEENIPHKVSEVICVDCKYRWVAVRPIDTLLKNLECPRCEQQGYVIETGEELKDSDMGVLGDMIRLVRDTTKESLEECGIEDVDVDRIHVEYIDFVKEEVEDKKDKIWKIDYD